MSEPPPNPKIYHITHVDNLASIVAKRCLESDARRIRLGLENTNIGMSEIKERRLRLGINCHPGTKVGEFVPFYFCPRSIMLFLIHRANHPDLTYRGGQQPIVHLEAGLDAVVRWAEANHRPWAFSPNNAGATYAVFYKNLNQLDQIDWTAVLARDFTKAEVKEGKQAEFLVYESFPWELIERVGVYDETIRRQLEEILQITKHRPPVSIERGWYY